MSSPGSVTVKESALGSGYKKAKKKRHRNKFRNSNSRKKRTKKYLCKKPNSFKSNNSKLSKDTGKIMSNWYWSNYKKAVEWQDRHKVAHWKACALALLEENRYLLQIINDMRPGMVPEISATQSHMSEGSNCKRKEPKASSSGYFTSFQGTADDACNSEEDAAEVDEENEDKHHCDDDEDYENNGDDTDDEDDIEFEMSEEMMQFFEQSYRHKMDLKKLKEKELLNKAEEEIKQLQSNKMKRISEMNLLYGDGASMIIGMETAVQLSFEKYCDTKSPKYWPNIPFRL